MKRFFLLSLAAAAVLVSCDRTAKTHSDVLTFGLKGDVKEVRYSLLAVSNSLDEDQGDPWLEQDELLLSFDEQGRVTRDDYGNIYAYDADGDFNGPYAEYTEVVRDASGRLKSFDNTAITGSTSVLYGCNRLVGGTGYVPTYSAGAAALSLGSSGVLTDPANDGRTWV